MANKSPIPFFNIAFDTNLLFVDAENKLLKDTLSEFISERNKLESPRVAWHLLDIVRAERRYQMLQVARSLLTQTQRVEKLLGKSLGIQKGDIEQGVDSAIANQVKQHKLIIRQLDTNRVDWSALIERSTTREPPFEHGPKEKGFRDAIVLETFSQLVDEHPANQKAVRHVLMTGDRLLKEALAARMSQKTNVLTVDNIEALKSLLNAHASHIAGELDDLLQKATRLFFQDHEKETLFYKWQIEQIIREKHGASLLEPPPGLAAGSTSVTAYLRSVGPTSFIDKIDQSLTFATNIDFEVFAAIPNIQSPYGGPTGPYGGPTGPYGGPTGLYGDPNFYVGPTGNIFSSLSPSVGSTFVAPSAYSSSFTGTGYSNTGSTFVTSTLPSEGTSYISTGMPSSSNIVSGRLWIRDELLPSFVYQRGRKVFEVRWNANLDKADDLTDPKCDQIGLHSVEW